MGQNAAETTVNAGTNYAQQVGQTEQVRAAQLAELETQKANAQAEGNYAQAADRRSRSGCHAWPHGSSEQGRKDRGDRRRGRRFPQPAVEQRPSVLGERDIRPARVLSA